tara:strand:+ start:303 stop:542 length:240 start_codon:yes stop_codon:yes gene_type:complete
MCREKEYQMMSKETINRLHNLLAQELVTRIESGEATPSELSVARAFLKDNNIEAVEEASEPLAELAKILPFVEPEKEAM